MKLLLLSTMLIISSVLFSQDWSTDVYKYGEQYPGYIITEKGDKIEGFIEYRNRYNMQNTVVFFKEKGNKKSKIKYKTGDLKEYQVADKTYHCIPYSGGLSKKTIKANLLVKTGCITEYVWYNRHESYLTMQKMKDESQEDYMKRMYPPSAVYLKQGDDESPRTIDYFALKFSKKMSEWIVDNSELSAKVAAKEKGYGMLSILAIIEEYNTNCEN